MAYRLDKALVPGKSTQEESDRSFCRKWVTNQAKAWARMHKVGNPEEGISLRCSPTVCILHEKK